MTSNDASDSPPAYGQADATFLAVGGEAGVWQLVNDFYDIIGTSDATQALKQMHADDLTENRDKLARFLCGWMGGPKRYRERYGPINILHSHQHLPISQAHHDQWLWAMQQAIAKQGFPESLARYLMQQLTMPANRILAQHSQAQQ
ncbi:group II truncated hemoglobin [Halioxenophilus aromaticivorans]|uniref:Group II truncated hemoglobin n=1 Tax=Halioxenophilus aromaticivorans TaxID=1306992 RepID=A0AAV3TZK4_9ALTE